MERPTPDYTAETAQILKDGGEEIIGNSPKPFIKICPVCRKLVDLNDTNAAIDHMQSHPKQMAEAHQKSVMDQVLSTGILRRI